MFQAQASSVSSRASHGHHRHSTSAVVHTSSNSTPLAVHASAGLRSPSSCSQLPDTCFTRNQDAGSSYSSRQFHRLIPAAAATGNSSSTASQSSSESSVTEAETSSVPPDAADGAAAEDEQSFLSDDPGPAFRDTLGMLEWKRLCEHLAKFSSTTIGKRLCLQLSVPLQEATSLRLQQEVRWVVIQYHLEPAADP